MDIREHDRRYGEEPLVCSECGEEISTLDEWFLRLPDGEIICQECAESMREYL